MFTGVSNEQRKIKTQTGPLPSNMPQDHSGADAALQVSTLRARCPPCERAKSPKLSRLLTFLPPGPPKALAPTGDRAGAVRPGTAGAAAREACRRRARSLQCVCDGAHAAAGREVLAKARSIYRTAERGSSTTRAMAHELWRTRYGLVCCKCDTCFGVLRAPTQGVRAR